MRYLAFITLFSGLTLAKAPVSLLDRALESYHQTHLRMAANDLGAARKIASEAKRIWSQVPEPSENLKKAQAGAEAVAAANTDLGTIQAFGKYSEGVVLHIAANQPLQAKWTRFRCPMTQEGVYQYWVQPVPEKLSNPYRTDMPTCGVKKPW